MASIDSVSLTILFGAVLVLTGIMSSLVALRFGAPLLLVFLLVGMLAGESGIGGIQFDDVRMAYTVGSVALGLILFDGVCVLCSRGCGFVSKRDRRGYFRFVPIFASFRCSWPRDVRLLSSSASILIARIPLRSWRTDRPM